MEWKKLDNGFEGSDSACVDTRTDAAKEFETTYPVHVNQVEITGIVECKKLQWCLKNKSSSEAPVVQIKLKCIFNTEHSS